MHRSKTASLSFFIGLAVLIGLVGCSSSDTGTTLERYFDPEATFANYNSFVILEQEKSPRAAPEGMQIDLGVKAASSATRELKAKGYKEAATVEDADFALLIHGQWFPKTKLYNTSFTPDYGSMGNAMYGYFDPSYGTGTTAVENNNEGMLAIEVYEVKSKKLVWLGFVRGTVDANTSSKDVRVGAAVTGILLEYPELGTEPKSGTPAKPPAERAAEMGLEPKK